MIMAVSCDRNRDSNRRDGHQWTAADKGTRDQH
jgi:hypothetical protein